MACFSNGELEIPEAKESFKMFGSFLNKYVGVSCLRQVTAS